MYQHLYVFSASSQGHRKLSPNTGTSVLGTHLPQEVKTGSNCAGNLCGTENISVSPDEGMLNSLNCLALEIPFLSLSKDKITKIGNLKYRNSFQALALGDNQLDCYLYCKQHKTNQ